LVVATMRSITPSVDKVRKKMRRIAWGAWFANFCSFSFSLSFCFAQFCFLSWRTMFQRILMEITGEENQSLRPKNQKNTKKKPWFKSNLHSVTY
jgi:hypothetical protein